MNRGRSNNWKITGSHSNVLTNYIFAFYSYFTLYIYWISRFGIYYFHIVIAMKNNICIKRNHSKAI